MPVKLEEALPVLRDCIGISFGDLFSNLPKDLITNKGNIGQLLLLKIGLKLDSNLTDFEDGELKTNKADPHGLPRETMFITQISQQIDNYVTSPPLKFRETNIYKKIRNLVFLPVCKDSKNQEDWFFTALRHINLDKNPALFNQLEEDYLLICEQLRMHILSAADGFIHTSNGHFIQVRSKDSKPYSPIYSEHLGRFISNKNHAFYFKKQFMEHCIKNDTSI